MPETKISGKVKLGRCASNLWRVSFTFKGVKHVIVVSVLIFLTPTFLGSGPLGSRHSVSTYLDSFDIGEWLSGLDNDSSRHGICFGLISLLELQASLFDPEVTLVVERIRVLKIVWFNCKMYFDCNLFQRCSHIFFNFVRSLLGPSLVKASSFCC